MVTLRVRAFTCPKAGNRPEEYEDAWAYNAAAKRLALADGASDAFESHLWARALVGAFVRQPPVLHCESLLSWLARPQQEWQAGIQWERLPWYAHEKAQRGAFATLLGLTFSPSGTASAPSPDSMAHWTAMAVGDACLFQVREHAVVEHFPVQHAADFGNTPPLLSTRHDYNRRSIRDLKLLQGAGRAGDLFVLATDALAAWLLQQIEGGKRPWPALERLTKGTFLRLIDSLRQTRAIRNDDVTLVLARIAARP
jgi:hypothetical protein